jgi:hypothetical protein
MPSNGPDGITEVKTIYLVTWPTHFFEIHAIVGPLPKDGFLFPLMKRQLPQIGS